MKFCSSILALVVSLTSTASASIIAQYSAAQGNPATAGDITGPLAQGWNIGTVETDFDAAATDVQTGVFEGGQAAWQNLDGDGNQNPGYAFTLTSSNYQQMWDNGWTMTATLSLKQGGHFFAWGADETNTVGNFGFTGNARAGFSVGVDGNDLTINPQGGTPLSVVEGVSNNTYVRIVVDGAPQSSSYMMTVFDDDANTILGTQTIDNFANGNNNNDDNFAIQSGSSGGDFREVYIRELRLEDGVIPEPSSVLLLGLGGFLFVSRRKR